MFTLYALHHQLSNEDLVGAERAIEEKLLVTQDLIQQVDRSPISFSGMVLSGGYWIKEDALKEIEEGVFEYIHSHPIGMS